MKSSTFQVYWPQEKKQNIKKMASTPRGRAVEKLRAINRYTSPSVIEKCYLLISLFIVYSAGDWQLSRGGQTCGSRAAALLDLLFKEQTQQQRDFSTSNLENKKLPWKSGCCVNFGELNSLMLFLQFIRLDCRTSKTESWSQWPHLHTLDYRGFVWVIVFTCTLRETWISTSLYTC